MMRFRRAVEIERKKFEAAFNLDISDKWDECGQFYYSVVGQDILNLWSGWTSRAFYNKWLMFRK
jgi:hypothetical protein